jgi:hypothetical protein
MVMANRDHVVKRLKELRDWADYIVQSLSADQPYERGKMDLLKQVVGLDDLDSLREEAESLASRLDRAVSRIDTPVPAA